MADEKKYYKYVDTDIDQERLLTNLNHNVRKYVEHKNWDDSRQKEFYDALDTMIEALKAGRLSSKRSGAITDSAGLIDNGTSNWRDAKGNVLNEDDYNNLSNKDKKKYSQNFYANREAATYFDLIVRGLYDKFYTGRKEDDPEKPKTQFDLDTHGLWANFTKRIAPGGTGDIEAWLDLDPYDKETKYRATTERAKDFASYIASYKEDLDPDLDFSGTQWKTRDRYLSAVDELAKALEKDGADNVDFRLLNSLGGTPAQYRAYFTTEETPSTTTTRDQEVTDGTLDPKVKAAYEALDRQYTEAYKRRGYREHSLPVGTKPTGVEMDKNPADPEKAYYAALSKNNISFEPEDLQRTDGKEYLNYMDQYRQFNKDAFRTIRLGDHRGWQYIPASLNLDDMSVLAYNPTRHAITRLFYKDIDSESRSEYAKTIEDIYADQQNRGTPLWKKGGTIQKFEAGSILDILYGDNAVKDFAEKARAHSEKTKSDPKTRKAGWQHAEENGYNAGDGSWTTADILRLTSIGTDIIAIADPEPISAFGIGLASDVQNFIADRKDGFSVAEALGRSAMNVGLSAIGIVPILGDALGSGAKVIKQIVKFVPRISGVINTLAVAGAVANAPAILHSLSKINQGGPENEMTVEDWRNVGMAVQLTLQYVSGKRTKNASEALMRKAAPEKEMVDVLVEGKDGAKKLLRFTHENDVAAIKAAKTPAEINEVIQGHDSYKDFSVLARSKTTKEWNFNGETWYKPWQWRTKTKTSQVKKSAVQEATVDYAKLREASAKSRWTREGMSQSMISGRVRRGKLSNPETVSEAAVPRTTASTASTSGAAGTTAASATTAAPATTSTPASTAPASTPATTTPATPAPAPTTTTPTTAAPASGTTTASPTASGTPASGAPSATPGAPPLPSVAPTGLPATSAPAAPSATPTLGLRPGEVAAKRPRAKKSKMSSKDYKSAIFAARKHFDTKNSSGSMKSLADIQSHPHSGAAKKLIDKEKFTDAELFSLGMWKQGGTVARARRLVRKGNTGLTTEELTEEVKKNFGLGYTPLTIDYTTKEYGSSTPISLSAIQAANAGKRPAPGQLTTLHKADGYKYDDAQYNTDEARKAWQNVEGSRTADFMTWAREYLGKNPGASQEQMIAAYNQAIDSQYQFKRDVAANHTGKNSYWKDPSVREFNRTNRALYRTANTPGTGIHGYSEDVDDTHGTSTAQRFIDITDQDIDVDFTNNFVEGDADEFKNLFANLTKDATGRYYIRPVAPPPPEEPPVEEPPEEVVEETPEEPPVQPEPQREPTDNEPLHDDQEQETPKQKGKQKGNWTGAFKAILPNLLGLGRYISARATNKKLADHAREAPVMLYDPKERHKWQTGDLQAVQRARRKAAKLTHAANTPITADGQVQLAAQLTARDQADEHLITGYQAHDTAAEQSRDAAWTQEGVNQESRYNVAMKNRENIFQKLMNIHQADDVRTAADHKSLDALLGEYETQAREANNRDRDYIEAVNKASITNTISANMANYGIEASAKDQQLINDIYTGTKKVSDLTEEEYNRYSQLKASIDEIVTQRIAASRGARYTPFTPATTTTAASGVEFEFLGRGGQIHQDTEKIAIQKLRGRVQRMQARQRALEARMNNFEKDLDRSQRSASQYVRGQLRK